jgi:hypothetical protein
MSKGSYRGRPLESYSKEELIEMVVMLATQRQQDLREAIDLVEIGGVWQVNERD